MLWTGPRCTAAPQAAAASWPGEEEGGSGDHAGVTPPPWLLPTARSDLTPPQIGSRAPEPIRGNPHSPPERLHEVARNLVCLPPHSPKPVGLKCCAVRRTQIIVQLTLFPNSNPTSHFLVHFIIFLCYPSFSLVNNYFSLCCILTVFSYSLNLFLFFSLWLAPSPS